MNKAKVQNVIEVASNVAVVAAALVVLVSFVRSHILPTPRVTLQGGLQKGAPFPKVPGLDFSKSQRTLLVAIDPNCEYCNESLPFFKNLADKLRGRPSNVRMITVFQSSEEPVRRYVEQSQLNVETVFGADFKTLNVSVIPALILIDNSGTILDFWIGKPSKEIEEQIIDHITAGA